MKSMNAVWMASAVMLLLVGTSLAEGTCSPYYEPLSASCVVSMPGCGNSDGCGGGCANPYCGQLCWVVGAEGTFLAPIGGENQTGTFTNLNTTATRTFTTDETGVENLTPAPRVWLGFVNQCGWGAQIRYWELNSTGDAFDPFVPVGPAPDQFGLNSASTLELQALDIEAMKEFCFCDWDMLGTFGYRHAARNWTDGQFVNAAADRPIGLGGGTTFVNGTSSGIYDFEGDGITFSLSATRPTCHCFDLFWSLRGSVIFGEGLSGSTASAVLSSPIGTANQTSIALADSSDTMFIGEAQVGIQWSKRLCCNGARFFARTAFEYQYWSETGGITGATATVGETGVAALTVNSNSSGESLNLVGFAIAAGMSW